MKIEKFSGEKNEMKNIFEGVEEVREEFFRSSGKGGQNVNKVETAVRIRAKVFDAILLERLRELYPGSVTDDNEFLVESQEERRQHQNRELAYARLKMRLEEARREPKERIETKPSRGAKEKRLKEKRATGVKKQERRKTNIDVE